MNECFIYTYILYIVYSNDCFVDRYIKFVFIFTCTMKSQFIGTIINNYIVVSQVLWHAFLYLYHSVCKCFRFIITMYYVNISHIVTATIQCYSIFFCFVFCFTSFNYLKLEQWQEHSSISLNICKSNFHQKRNSYSYRFG